MEEIVVKAGTFVTRTINNVLVIDRNYRVLYNNRDDAKNSKEPLRSFCVERGKNFFEAYPTVDPNDSSIVETMNTGKVTERYNQHQLDFKGKVYVTNNITIPIINEGIIVGAIELAQDVTTVDSIERLKEQNKEKVIKTPVKTFFGFDDILTQDKQMEEVKRRAELFSTSGHPTLIYGETGTGKELLAQSMILRSGVPRNKVVIQNCAAVPENLLEMTLFGSYKGAFTGAQRVEGLFEQADGGILFLDELNSMPLHVQGKLLRVLQDGSFRPIGSEKEKRVRVKVIATVNVEPQEAVDKGILRADLFYRFSGNLLSIPPLRERKGDIAYYADYFLKESCGLYKKPKKSFDPTLSEFLDQYAWPGNVRELKLLVESLVNISTEECISLKDLPAYLYNRVIGKTSPQSLDKKIKKHKNDLGLVEFLEEVEKEYISDALQREDNKIGKAAERLNIPRQTLHYKMKKYGL